MVKSKTSAEKDTRRLVLLTGIKGAIDNIREITLRYSDETGSSYYDPLFEALGIPYLWDRENIAEWYKQLAEIRRLFQHYYSRDITIADLR